MRWEKNLSIDSKEQNTSNNKENLSWASSTMSDPVAKLVCLFVCLCQFFDFARLLPLDSGMCSELICDDLGVRNDKLSIVTDIQMWYLDWSWTWCLKYIYG